VLISIAMGETGDSMFWSGSEEGGSVRSKCEEDEDTHCEDADGTPTGKGILNLTCFVVLSV
jgi:hypothetical protein